MRKSDAKMVPARRRRACWEYLILAILLLSVVLTLFALKFDPPYRSLPTVSAGTASDGGADEIDALLSRLSGRIPSITPINECGEECVLKLRTLAREEPENARQLNFMADNLEIYAQEHVDTALLGGDHVDFALQIPFSAPDISGSDALVQVSDGEIPYLSQYDARWGYYPYGGSIVGISGCGPTCLAMAAAGLTGDTACNPARVADYAEEAGYYVPGTGTSWALFTEGAAHFGLNGTEIPLDENVMRNNLNSGAVIAASMLPGDFTQSGHFILICSAESGGFRVKDPNSAENSSAVWSYERLAPQIANLWVLTARA